MRERVKTLIYSHLSGRQKCKVLQGIILADFEHNNSIFDNRIKKQCHYTWWVTIYCKKHIDTTVSQIRL